MYIHNQLIDDASDTPHISLGAILFLNEHHFWWPVISSVNVGRHGPLLSGVGVDGSEARFSRLNANLFWLLVRHAPSQPQITNFYVQSERINKNISRFNVSVDYVCLMEAVYGQNHIINNLFNLKWIELSRTQQFGQAHAEIFLHETDLTKLIRIWEENVK